MILVQAAEKLVVNRLHGTIGRVNEHHYSFTKKSYNKFELNALIKTAGNDDAGFGVCIRINPADCYNAPRYQADMGIVAVRGFVIGYFIVLLS